MLKAANSNVKYCYERALEAEERAAAARNPDERRFYLDDEARWLALGASYEFVERLGLFLKELRGYVKAPLCFACDCPMRPKRLVQSDSGLFEFQFECANCGAKKTISELKAEVNHKADGTKIPSEVGRIPK